MVCNARTYFGEESITRELVVTLVRAAQPPDLQAVCVVVVPAMLFDPPTW